MRQGRAPSRGATRTNTSSPSPSVANALVKKATKLPQIMGAPDDASALSGSGNSQASSGLIVGVCSQQGKRPYQEDEYSIRQYLNQSSPPQEDGVNVETHYFGLFDGHAGGRCSNYVAGTLCNVLAEDAAFFTNLPQALKRSYHQTNDMFLKVAEKMKYHDGSTGITAVVRDTKVLVANVGDCRCLIISGGRPIQMSIDQKPTNPEEQKRIAALGGTVVYCMGVARVNRVLAVSRAFGNRTLRTVIRPDAEMMQRELTRDDDYIVMASDGLWDVLKNKDVCDMCYSPFAQGNAQTIADELVHTALMRGSMDNVTCIVVKLADYVQRLFGGKAGGASASGPGGGGAVGMLERSASLKNVPGSNMSQRMPNVEQGNSAGTGSNQQSGGTATAGPGGLFPMSKQYSTGSMKQQEPQPLQLQQPAQVMPALDNYMYSPSRNRTNSNGGADSPLFTLPSAGGVGGRNSPGIAALRQHMHREGSFNYEEDEQTVSGGIYSGSSGGTNSATNSGSGNSWGAQPSLSNSSAGQGVAGFGQGAQASSIPYAARRPNTMGGAATNVLGPRSSFSNGMPNLISMFNNSMPQISGAAGNGNTLAPLPASSSPMSGAGGAMWNSEGDYSGSSYGTDSTSGSRMGQPQRAGALGTMFPVNYKRVPSRK